jgi:hypothetical protein
LAERASPTLRPDIVTVGWLEQSSSAGSGSPITVPFETMSGIAAGVAPCVCPATRLKAPGVDGPNVEPKEASLIAYRCA